jgi:hypothetical protein
MAADRAQSQSSSRLTAAAAALTASAGLFESIGSPLYATLCARAAKDPDLVSLVAQAREGAAPMHLLSSVHYLLLRSRSNDPLTRYFATLTPDPASPAGAFPEFARFCAAHRGEIVQLLETRTVQTTYAERCRTIMPLLSRVADLAGEPLNLIEIGCSAGVLLTFDQYAYRLDSGRLLGEADAPLTLPLKLTGGPVPRIPKIGTRVGLDLHVIDVRSEDERCWLLALSFPEHREQQAALARALEVVARTPMRMIEGDALRTLPALLEQTPEPVCVYHSACLMYWPAHARAALEDCLLRASAGRTLYRVAVEPTERFISEQTGKTMPTGAASAAAGAAGAAGAAEAAPAAGSSGSPPVRGEAVISCYRNGVMSRIAVARTASDYGTIEWLD